VLAWKGEGRRAWLVTVAQTFGASPRPPGSLMAMRDDGTAGDAVAGDAIFTAVLPASVQTHRRLVRYRINVTDIPGKTAGVPYLDDEQPNFAYFVYNGAPAWTGRNVSRRPATAAHRSVATCGEVGLHTPKLDCVAH
jgi:hypothetical protein